MSNFAVEPSMLPEASAETKFSSTPLVSVVMLAFNHAAYIEQAIESVLAQETAFRFELLIGEDASTDATREIVLRMRARSPAVIRVFAWDDNLGMQRNLAALVGAATGEYLAFCEGDDYWTDARKLQKQVDLLAMRDDVGAVHTDFSHVVRLMGRWRALVGRNQAEQRYIPQGMVFEVLLQGNFMQTCTVCARACLVREYYRVGLPFESYPVGDWPLFLFIASRSELAYIPESTSAYRKASGSVMNSGWSGSLRITKGYLGMLSSICDFAGADSAARNFAVGRIYKAWLSLALLAGDRQALQASWDWLETNDPEYLKPLRRRLMPFLGRFPLAVLSLRLVNVLRQWLYYLFRYTPRAPLPAGLKG